VSVIETMDWKSTSSTPGADSRKSVGRIGAEKKRSEAVFNKAEIQRTRIPGTSSSAAAQPSRTPMVLASMSKTS